MNRINLILQNPHLKNTLYVLMGMFVVIPIIGSILKSGVDCDSAYYICMGERIAEGYIPYADLNLSYTPLWFYIEAGYKLLFNIPNGLYWPYLLLFYLFEMATAYFLYRFICLLQTPKHYALFGSGLFLIIIHWLGGNCVLLEIPFMFWGWLSCWLILQWKEKPIWLYVLVGFFSACSFLTKQYGLGFLILNLYLILFEIKSRQVIFLYLIGYIFPVVLAYIIYGDSIIYSTLLNGYGTKAALESGVDISISSKITCYHVNLMYFTKMICPAWILSLLFLYNSMKAKRLRYMLFAYCGIMGFALQFFFSVGYHYFIPLVPFGVIIITEILTLKSNKYWSSLKYLLVILFLSIALYKTYYNRVYKLYINGNIREHQEKIAAILKNHIEAEKTLFIPHDGIYYLYFMADVLPPNIATIGYSFGPMGLNEKLCAAQIAKADYVLRFSRDWKEEVPHFTDSLKHIVEEYPIIEQFGDSAILLHKMH